MKSRTYLRLAVFLLDAQHHVKAAALAEGQPRYAMRRAVEQALRLCAISAVDGPRLVIIPAGTGGTLSIVAERARSFSKAGQALTGMEGAAIRRMGRLAAFQAFCGLLAEQVRCERARDVQGEVLATT